MGDEEFKNKVERELESLSHIQMTHFAWLCGARALPFLGAEGNFDFWKTKDRLGNVYSIFFVLDYSYAFASASFASASFASASSYAGYAAKTASSAAVSASASVDVSPAVADVADAVADVASAADAAAAVADAAESAWASASSASASHAAFAAIYAVIAAKKFSMDLEPVILDDLTNIELNNIIQNHRTDWYGGIWDNFQTALKNEGCGYWGRLYKQIFDDEFILDVDVLEKRLNVPNEMKAQGAVAVADYLDELEKGATRLNEARIIILGDKGAGKTCIARKLIDPNADMTTDDESTAGVDTSVWKLEEDNINVRIWDFAGHTVTHAVHQFFLSERCLYLLVYDGRTEERNRLVYWLDHMKNYGGDSSAIILVNKRDFHSVDIPINLLKEKYSIAGIYVFSIKDDKKDLSNFRKEVTEYIKSHPSWENTAIPTHYFQVKEELEKRFDKEEEGRNQEHITKDEFDKIAEQFKVEDTEKLLGALHSLGVSLWYRNMENFNTLILNPEWISHGVYQIINWVNNEKKYSLNIEDFEKVFKQYRNRFPKDKHRFFFELMRRFELAYKVADEERLIIPHLLKEDRPEKLPEFPIGEALMLRYCAEQPLPPHTISRFIVRHNREIKKEREYYQVWRHGVVLERDNTIALVREVDRTISVSLKGPHKNDYINVLRETLNDVFDSYNSDKPELQYRIRRHGKISDEVEAQYPLWVAEKGIVKHYQSGIPYFDYIADQNVSMDPTVDNYRIHANKTFNFSECSIFLQGELNELAQLLKESDKIMEANHLSGAAKVLEQVKNSESGEELMKSGVMSRLKRWFDNVNDTDSALYKSVNNIKNGGEIAQDIAKRYNEIAQWAGLPQVPKPFLKKKKS